MSTEFIVSISCGFFLSILVLIVYTKIKNKQFIIRYHKNYQQLFGYYLDMAYETIWKTQIVGYYNEGLKPSGSERETMTRNFCKSVVELMGPKLEKYFVEFFGSEEALWANIINFFDNRLDTDEIEDLLKRGKKEEQQDITTQDITANARQQQT